MVSKTSTCAALTFAVFFPSLVTWAYFVALNDSSPAVQQAAYAIGKGIQFAFPVAWLMLAVGEKVRIAPPTRSGVWPGLGFGILILVAMLALYYSWLRPAGFFDGPSTAIRAKIAGLGLDTTAKYAAVGLFYAICHSLLEEYYWRWFVFRQLDRHFGFAVGLVVSSLGFMAHHVILLATYFGLESPATVLFSLSVAIGGAVWAWLYHRSQSLYATWISHALVDAAIFVIGYDLARDLFS